MADLIWSACRWGQFLSSLIVALAVVAPARAESLAARLLADAADGELDEHEFISAALIASGVSDGCELARWESAYAELRSSALATLKGGSLNERMAAVQAALHERILIGRYVSSASDLRTALSRGDYNCLSSLALHWDLCNRAGLTLEICSQPGHVNLRLAEGIEIEPGARAYAETVADGRARLLPSRESSGSVGLSRSFALPRTSALPKRQLSPVELLGKFYYNRGVEQLREGRFAEGVALLKTSLQLDPADSDARENLLAGLNNWAVEHCRKRRYDLAAPLIEQGLLIEPAFAPLVANERLVRDKLPK